MANIGDKSFTTQMASAIKSIVVNHVGNVGLTNLYGAQVYAVDAVNSTVDVKIGGDTNVSTGFNVRGMQMPVINDFVAVAISGAERWVEYVYRPVSASSYPSFAIDNASKSINVTGRFNAPVHGATYNGASKALSTTSAIWTLNTAILSGSSFMPASASNVVTPGVAGIYAINLKMSCNTTSNGNITFGIYVSGVAVAEYTDTVPTGAGSGFFVSWTGALTASDTVSVYGKIASGGSGTATVDTLSIIKIGSGWA